MEISTDKSVDQLANRVSPDPLNFIIIEGARVNNLKNISVAIPRNRLIVITGLSGSGKSSLAFDTLYAEGQRRYVESLSAYVRQFMGKIEKPEVDKITGISPAIAIEQKVVDKNPRSTVGTSTETLDYLKLLFSRIGKTYSPLSGNLVKRDTVSDVVDHILSMKEGTKAMVLAPYNANGGKDLYQQLETLLQQGFSRVKFNGSIHQIEECLGEELLKNEKNLSLSVVIDRVVVKEEDKRDMISRLSDSVQSAFYEGEGSCIIDIIKSTKVKEETESILFSNKFELDGIKFEQPSEHFFSFNNPYGACKGCEGFGSIIGIDKDLVIPNKKLSVYEDAIVCWKGEKLKKWKERLIMNAIYFDFPVHRPYCDLTTDEKELLWTGNKYFRGLTAFFKYIERKAYKIQYRVMLSRYRGKTICPDCRGTRLRPDAAYVKVDRKSILDLLAMPVSDLNEFFKGIKLSAHDQKVAKRLLIEIKSRLNVLCEVGLGYLTLNRLSNTLSGGESQRINLATSLGSSLVGSMYILDEPSIGLHPRDTKRLIAVLKNLKNLGNTVIVVEHDEEIMRSADQIIDLGPNAGSEGGEIVFQGGGGVLIKETKSLTARYLNGSMKIEIPLKRRPWSKYIEIRGAAENNLKGIDVKFPLGVMCAVTGVSGSGKSSLVKGILYPALNNLTGQIKQHIGPHDEITGDVESLANVEFVNQNPIGKSSRSNPATYVKVYDDIRMLFAEEQLSKQLGFKPANFSFNVPGGRCEECEGEGKIHIEMQFMADVQLICESCKGKRFKKDVLDVRFNGKNIIDILDLTIDDAMEFFGRFQGALERSIVRKLRPLFDVGMGYVKLGQPSSTLSGGEAQRVKLATFLGIKKNEFSEKSTLFIFDEPTTGLHFHDINNLLGAFNALIDQGNTVIVIEHNLDVIKNADWVIDLGPGGGEAGGYLVFEGTPEELSQQPNSATGFYLKNKVMGASPPLADGLP